MPFFKNVLAALAAAHEIGTTVDLDDKLGPNLLASSHTMVPVFTNDCASLPDVLHTIGCDRSSACVPSVCASRNRMRQIVNKLPS